MTNEYCCRIHRKLSCQLALLTLLSSFVAAPTFAQQNQSSKKAKDPSKETEIKLPEKIEWQKYRDGIQLAKIKLSKPRPLNLVVARIDLNEKVKIVVTPDNGEKKLETTGLKVSTFLKKHDCDIAVNAAPFRPVLMLENGQHDVAGLQIADGKTISPGDKERPVVCFDKKNRAEFHSKPPKKAGNVWNAVSGFQIVLKDGKARGKGETLHPRTALGTNKDGSQLVLLVVDGRQKGKSEGTTTREAGELLRQFGCFNGINLDGGGTSTMVVKDENGKPKVLNVPIHLGIPGTQRPTGSHFGIVVPRKK